MLRIYTRLIGLTLLLLCLAQKSHSQIWDTIPNGQLWPQGNSTVFWVDHNGDGYQDVLEFPKVSKPDFFYRYTFDSALVLAKDSIPLLVGQDLQWTVGDLNLDLWQDLVQSGYLANGDPFTRVWFDVGGSWEPDFEANWPVVGRPMVLDVDHNGAQDLVLLGEDAQSDAGLWWMHYVPETGWEMETLDERIGYDSATHGQLLQLWFADLDNDGWEEIITYGQLAANAVVSCFKYVQEDDEYTELNTELPHWALGGAAWGDYNHDGFVDVLLQDALDSADIWLNNGTGKFLTTVDHLNILPLDSLQAFLVDVNGDGLTDVVTGGYGADGPMTLAYRQGIAEVDTLLADQALATGFAMGHANIDGHLEVAGRSLVAAEYPEKNWGPGVGPEFRIETYGEFTTFNWSEGEDDNTPGPALTFDLLVTSDTDITVSANYSPTTGYRLQSGPGKAGHGRKYPVRGMETGSYTWLVQPLDNAYWPLVCPLGEECPAGICEPQCFDLVREDTLICWNTYLELQSPWEGVSLEWTSKDGTLLGTGNSLYLLLKEPMEILGWGESGNCQLNFAATITLAEPLPDSLLTRQLIDACVGDTVHLSVSDSLVVDWYENEMLTVTNQSNYSFTRSAPGIVDVNVTGVSYGGCLFSDTIATVTFHEAALTVGPDQSIWAGQSVELLAEGVGTFVWAPAESLDDPTSPTPMASPKESTEYTVWFTSAGGCRDSAMVYIEVLGPMFLPELFTPNGDGTNDTFKVYGKGIATLQLKVYDRDGRQVFYSEDINELLNQGWDGTYRGNLLPPGTYTWVVRGTYADGTALQYNGNTTGAVRLIR